MLEGQRLSRVRVPWLFGTRRRVGKPQQEVERMLDVKSTASRVPMELRAGSPVIEACRTLRANLRPGQVEAVPPSLLVVGTTADRTCGLLAAGLAHVLGEERPTLLVDADLRSPMLHELYGLPPGPGLANILEEDSDALDIERCKPTLVTDYLWVLPAGTSMRNPAELLRRPNLRAFTRHAEETFEAVVYHASGRWDHPDSLLLAAHVRASLLAVRVGRDSVDQVRRVEDLFVRSGVEVLGFALLDPES